MIQNLNRSPGLNIAGFFTTESGLGQAVRGVVASCDAASIPTALCNVTITPSRRCDTTYQDRLTDVFPYDTSLIHINPDCLDVFLEDAPPAFTQGIRIAYWVWEVPTLPTKWKRMAEKFDAIWTPSTYSQRILENELGRPVQVVPHAMSQKIRNSKFEIRNSQSDENRKTSFLTTFDYLSIFDRKNPLAVIDALLEAFPGDENVELLIKAVNAEKDPVHHKVLQAAAAKDSRIRYVNDYCTHEELLTLIANASAFVSLHRAEGFGLGIAEAAVLGTPVIQTSFSGPLDFLHPGNSYCIDFALQPIETTGPYPGGGTWADPDIADAARHMRRVYEQPEEATKMAERAKEDVEKILSAKRIGSLIKEELRKMQNSELRMKNYASK